MQFMWVMLQLCGCEVITPTEKAAPFRFCDSYKVRMACKKDTMGPFYSVEYNQTIVKYLKRVHLLVQSYATRLEKGYYTVDIQSRPGSKFDVSLLLSTPVAGKKQAAPDNAIGAAPKKTPASTKVSTRGKGSADVNNRDTQLQFLRSEHDAALKAAYASISEKECTKVLTSSDIGVQQDTRLGFVTKNGDPELMKRVDAELVPLPTLNANSVHFSAKHVGGFKKSIKEDPPVIYYLHTFGASSDDTTKLEQHSNLGIAAPELGLLVPGAHVVGKMVQPYLCGMTVAADKATGVKSQPSSFGEDFDLSEKRAVPDNYTSTSAYEGSMIAQVLVAGVLKQADLSDPRVVAVQHIKGEVMPCTTLRALAFITGFPYHK